MQDTPQQQGCPSCNAAVQQQVSRATAACACLSTDQGRRGRPIGRVRVRVDMRLGWVRVRLAIIHARLADAPDSELGGVVAVVQDRR